MDVKHIKYFAFGSVTITGHGYIYTMYTTGEEEVFTSYSEEPRHNQTTTRHPPVDFVLTAGDR